MLNSLPIEYNKIFIQQFPIFVNKKITIFSRFFNIYKIRHYTPLEPQKRSARLFTLERFFLAKFWRFRAKNAIKKAVFATAY